MTVIVFAILILLVIQIVMYVVLDRLNKEYESVLNTLKKKYEFDNVTFQATQVLKDRIDAVCIVAESNAEKCDRLTQKTEVAEIQILNLTNKVAQHNTAIQKLQDSCIEVK